MNRRVLLACAASAALAGTGCDIIFPLTGPDDRPNQHFAGCFKGPVSDPAGPGEVTFVFEASTEGSHNLEGCFRQVAPEFDGVFTGLVDDENQEQATLAVMLTDFSAVMRVVKTPPDPGVDAVTISVTNTPDEAIFPFHIAEPLARCNMTCADLGIAQPFAPGGGP